MSKGAELTALGDDGFLGGADLEGAQVVERQETVVVRGEAITVATRVRVMPDGSQFRIEGKDPDPLDLAYAEYRRRHGWLSGRELAEWRASLGNRAGVTQRELARLLGFGEVTLKRYETGSLPTEAHEKMLRLARDPTVLRRVVAETPEALPEPKRSRVLAALDGEKASPNAQLAALFRNSQDAASVTTGFRTFDFDRARELVIRATRQGVAKTKLNKLMFYCDFRMFREATVSITGLAYPRLQFGPVPNDYEILFGILARDGAISVQEVAYPNGASGELITASAAPSDGLLTAEEIAVIDGVVSDFRSFSAVAISQHSHEEEGWTKTPTGQAISYEYAFSLIPVRCAG